MGGDRFFDLEEISDNRKYQDIALLIDREDFQKDLKTLRKDIRNLSIPNTPLSKLLRSGFELNLARKLVLKYKYPPSFGQSLLVLIEKGKIKDEDVGNLHVNVNLLPTLDESIPYYPSKGEILISIYQYAFVDRIDQILGQIEKIVKKALTKQEILPLPKDHPLSQHVIPKIRKQRWLYWVHKTGVMGYGKLAKEEYYNMNRETLISRINSYKKLLKLRV